MSSGIIKLVIGSVVVLVARSLLYKVECLAVFPSNKLKKDHNFNLDHHENTLQ